MIKEILPLLILGIFLIIGLIAFLLPNVIKEIQVKYFQSQYNLFKKIPGLNKVQQYNLETQKSLPLSSIRLTGLLMIIFLGFVLSLILAKK